MAISFLDKTSSVRFTWSEIASENGLITVLGTGEEYQVKWSNREYTPFAIATNLWTHDYLMISEYSSGMYSSGIDYLITYINTDEFADINGVISGTQGHYNTLNGYTTIKQRIELEEAFNYDLDKNGTIGKINAVGQAPTNIELSAETFQENIANGATVANLSTTDADSGDIHVYSLASGTSDTDNSAFTISGNQLKINASPDYETKNSYSIRVRTTDAGGLTYEESFNLSVNNVAENQSPTDISISSGSFNENISVGTAVATLSTTDPNSGDTFTYSLVSGTGDTDNSAFTISGNQLKINASPDYETKNSYSIRVRTTDAGGLTYEESLNLSVNDVDESIETAITNSTIITNSKSIFNTSVNGESFDYYIHPGGDLAIVGFNDFGNPTIQQTISSSAYESYIVSLFDQIDAVIDLDFTRQLNNDGTTIDIYAVADDGTNKVGATYFWNSWFDIDFEITGNSQFDQNTLVHELGHTLGLGHPFDDGFDARYTVDDTVMSYNIGSSGWTTYFTEADLSVLKNIWGVENDVVNTGGGGGGGGGGEVQPRL